MKVSCELQEKKKVIAAEYSQVLLSGHRIQSNWGCASVSDTAFNGTNKGGPCPITFVKEGAREGYTAESLSMIYENMALFFKKYHYLQNMYLNF